MTDTGTLILEVRPGERVTIGDCTVELIHKSGRAARLSISAPLAVQIKKSAGDASPAVGGADPSMA